MHNQYYFVFVKQTLVAVLSVLVAAFYFDKMPFRTHRMVPTFVNANSPPQLKAAILPQLVTIHPNNFFFSVQRCHFTFKTLTLKTLRLFSRTFSNYERIHKQKCHFNRMEETILLLFFALRAVEKRTTAILLPSSERQIEDW